MAKKLKEFAIFGKVRYRRDSNIYKTNAEVRKYAEQLRTVGYNVIMDKNSYGHFVWKRK